MCYAKPGPRCSKHAREKLIKARATENKEEIEQAMREYYLTPDGIREVEKKDPSAAQVLRRERKHLINAVTKKHEAQTAMQNGEKGAAEKIITAVAANRHSHTASTFLQGKRTEGLGDLKYDLSDLTREDTSKIETYGDAMDAVLESSDLNDYVIDEPEEGVVVFRTSQHEDAVIQASVIEPDEGKNNWQVRFEQYEDPDYSEDPYSDWGVDRY